MASNLVRNEIQEVVREEVSRLLGSTSSTSGSTSTTPEWSRESETASRSITPQSAVIPSSSGASCSDSSEPTLSFEEFYKMRQSQRQKGFKPPSKKKKTGSSNTGSAPKRDTSVEIKVGIAAQTDGVIKLRRGKTHVIAVNSSASKEEIIQKAMAKHTSFDQSFDETVAYVLLYPDFREVRCIPGTTQPFILSSYKQALGKDFKRLTFYLIALDDIVDKSDESDNEALSKSVSFSDLCRYFTRVCHPAEETPAASKFFLIDDDKVANCPSTSHALSGKVSGLSIFNIQFPLRSS